MNLRSHSNVQRTQAERNALCELFDPRGQGATPAALLRGSPHIILGGELEGCDDRRCLGSLFRTVAAIAVFSIAPLGFPSHHAFASDPAPTASEYTETVTVTSTRLADREEPAREVPASTSVITREQIESSGARTVQDLLSRVAGAVMFDQIGNAIQTTFDLRGFTGGGVTVLVDGARINDPRNNSVLLETILLDSVERIEVMRGAAAATVGGGSAAGVISIVTRHGESAPLSARVTGAGGSYGTTRAVIDLSGTIPAGSGGSNSESGLHETDSSTLAGGAGGGPDPSNGGGTPGFDWLVNAARDRSNGFRENAEARLTRATAGAGYTWSNGARASATLRSADDEIGAPGALTLAERDADPDDSPFNRLDNSDVSYRQGTLNWRSPLGARASLAANLSYLSRDATDLTTGRSAALFGGFILDSRVRTLGGAVQSTILARTVGIEHTLTVGGEELGGTSDARGCGTSPGALDRCDPASFLNSRNRTRRTDTALFAQDSASVGGNVTLLAGGRWDRSRFEYRESLPDPANDQRRIFSESSWKAGAAWNPLAELGPYASYGESFQPPTVEDLFAFPGFGSNPDLRPVTARNYEIGARGILFGHRSSDGRRRSSRGGSSSSGFGDDSSGKDVWSSAKLDSSATEQGSSGTPRPSSKYRPTSDSEPQFSGAGGSYSGGRVGRPSGFVPTLAYSISIFRTNLTNEIIFVAMPTPGNPFGGMNLNAARSRREGIEVSGDWRIFRWLAWSFAYTHTRATFENGANDGNEIPLVPKNRYSESTYLSFPKGITARVDLLHVGEQVLASDEANQQRRLDGYLVVDARVAWKPRFGPIGAPPIHASTASSVSGGAASTNGAGRGLGIELFLEGRNLFDEEYATRGIFSAFAGGVFVTPAPGRTLVAGASLTF